MEPNAKETKNLERTGYANAVSSARPIQPPIMPERYNSTSSPVQSSLLVPELSTTSSPADSLVQSWRTPSCL